MVMRRTKSTVDLSTVYRSHGDAQRSHVHIYSVADLPSWNISRMAR